MVEKEGEGALLQLTKRTYFRFDGIVWIPFSDLQHFVCPCPGSLFTALEQLAFDVDLGKRPRKSTAAKGRRRKA